MSRIKFNHVFAVLMLAGAASAFAIPSKYTARAQPQVQRLFAPVAVPARSAAGWAHERLARPAQTDPRDPRAVAAENADLREQVASLGHALAALERLDDERSTVGSLREQCVPVRVIGGDAGFRDGLLLNGSSLDGLAQGQPVLYGNALAGRIERPPGPLGAQVRLITDRGMRVDASFGRFAPNKVTGKPEWKPIQTSPVLIEGAGNGTLRCATDLTMTELQSDTVKLAAGDWVVLEDNEWDERVHGRLLGRVTRVAPQNAAPLYADIRIEPAKSLARLREVMVLTK